MNQFEIKITALIVEDDKVLMIRERNTDNHKYYWNLVKGSFDPKIDKSLFDTVIRECEEEINTKIKIKKLINVIYYRKGGKIRIQFNFLCSGQTKKAFLSNATDQKSRNEDIVKIKLFTKNQLKRMKKTKFLNNRIYVIIKDYLAGKFKDISTIREIIEL